MPLPTMIATGVASPSAQGQLTTSTQMPRASANPKLLPRSSHTIVVTTAIPMTAGTNTAETLSAIRAIGAFVACASATVRMIRDSVVSLPTLDALQLLFGIKKSDVYKKLDADETKDSRYQILKENVTMEQKTAWETYCDLDNEELSKEELLSGASFVKEESGSYSVDITANSNVKYDLVGKLVDETGLTRKAIIQILRGIEKHVFDQFRHNPEEFIIKAAALINDEKATAIIEHITYDVMDARYDTDIFTEPTIKGKLGTNAMKANKHLYDHIVYDSTNEKAFAEKLDTKGINSNIYNNMRKTVLDPDNNWHQLIQNLVKNTDPVALEKLVMK